MLDRGLLCNGCATRVGTFRNGATWALLHALSSEGLVLADLDASGKDEVLVDFGAAFGLWRYANDSIWTLTTQAAVDPETMAVGRFHDPSTGLTPSGG